MSLVVSALSANVVVLVNPHAGKGWGAKAAEAAVTRLRELGAQVEVRQGSSAEDSRNIARAAVLARPDALVVVGGDGTLATILPELAHSGVPVALVPAGTGNDFSRALWYGAGHDAAQRSAGNSEALGNGRGAKGLRAAARAAELALTGVAQPVDLGRVTAPEGSALFLTIVAMGFDAAVSDRTNRLRWPSGAARYYLALVLELLRLKPLDFVIGQRAWAQSGAQTSAQTATPSGVPGEAEGAAPAERHRTPGIIAAVANTRCYGGGMPICPDADPHDGLLDLTHVGPIGRARLVWLFRLLLQGRHTARPEVMTARAESFEVQAPGLMVYADGERVGTGRALIEVVPDALLVFGAGKEASAK